LIHSYNLAFAEKKRRDEVFDRIVEFVKENPPPFPISVRECESLCGAKYGWMVMVFFKCDPHEADDYFCEMIAKIQPHSDHCGIDEHLRGDTIPYGRQFP